MNTDQVSTTVHDEIDYDLNLDLMPKKNAPCDKQNFFFHNFKYKPQYKKEEMQRKSFFQKAKIEENNSKSESSVKQVRHQDLPYMGTISLENHKPRRGRKPKKSDIYHLIKNYGINLSSNVPEEKNSDESVKIKSKSQKRSFVEPLNLCLRDSEVQQTQKELATKNIRKKLEAVSQKKKNHHSINSSTKNEVMSICKFKLSNGSLHEKKFISVVNGNFNFGDHLKRQTSEDNKIKKTPLKKTFSQCSSAGELNKSLSTHSELSLKAISKKIVTHQDNFPQTLKNFESAGFLIQTQEQQTSNQCGFYKFRHLKTISRYLFRNWKNYLPVESKAEKKIPSV